MTAILRRLAPPVRSAVEAVLTPVLADGSRACNVCGQTVRRFRPLPAFYADQLTRHGWPHALADAETLNQAEYSCPRCGAHDRDRLFALYLSDLLTAAGPGATVRLLDIAPSRPLADFLRRTAHARGIDLRYRSADLSGLGVDDQLDVTRMSGYPDGAWDIILCSHVLEHVPDDRAAFRELHRVTAAGGRVLLLVPIVRGVAVTDEDPAVTDPGERWRRFGQDDHVRLYAKADFTDRTRAAGFRVEEVPAAGFGADRCRLHAVTAGSVMYVGHRDAG